MLYFCFRFHKVYTNFPSDFYFDTLDVEDCVVSFSHICEISFFPLYLISSFIVIGEDTVYDFSVIKLIETCFGLS